MPKPIRRILIIIIFAGAAYLLMGRSLLPDPPEKVPWRTSFPAAREEAQKANKPLLLYFTAAWCGPCQSLKSTLWADDQVNSALTADVPVKLDIDDPANKAIALQYRVDQTGIPEFVLVDTSGNTINATTGAMPREDFLSWLNAAKR